MRFNKIFLFAGALASSSFASKSATDKLILAEIVLGADRELAEAIRSVEHDLSEADLRVLNESMIKMGHILMSANAGSPRKFESYRGRIMDRIAAVRSRKPIGKAAGGGGGGGGRADAAAPMMASMTTKNVQDLLAWDTTIRDMVDSIAHIITPAEARQLDALLVYMGNIIMRQKVAEGEVFMNLFAEWERVRDEFFALVRQVEARRVPDPLPDGPPAPASRIIKLERNVSVILEHDPELLHDIDQLEGIMTEDEIRAINDALWILGNRAMRMRAADDEIIDQLMNDATMARDGLSVVLERIKARIPLPHEEVEEDGEGYIVGIDFEVSDKCIAQPFRNQLLARLQEFKDMKAAPPRAEVKPHKPVEEMTFDEQMAFMLESTVGSNLVEEKFDLHARPGWLGVRNLGSTCYLGAILQLFLHTDAFVNAFLTPDRPRSVRGDLLRSEDYTTSSFSHLVQQMWVEAGDHGGEPLVPADLLCSLHQSQAEKNEFTIHRQADAHEAINLILNKLDAHVGLRQIMLNRVVVQRGCHACGVDREPREVESFELLIPIPEVPEKDQSISLEQCIQAWKQAQLQFSGCCRAERAFENSAIQSTGELLLIELVRFRNLYEKIHTLIDIPVELALWVGRDIRVYTLVGFVDHSGADRASGHYTSTVYHQTEDVWLHANDRSVSATQVTGRFSSRQAYLLMYQELPEPEHP